MSFSGIDEEIVKKQAFERLGKRLNLSNDVRIDIEEIEVELSVNSFDELDGGSRFKSCKVVIYQPWTEHKKDYNLVHYASVYKYTRTYDDKWIWNGHYKYSFKKQYVNWC